MLVFLSTSQVPSQIVAADLYPADFDPLYDLPLPPAWHDTEGFDTTSEALLDQIANQTKVRVRVDPRLPAVESERLDEDQRTQWAEDQAAAQQALLDRLPDGSYQCVEGQPEVNKIIQVDGGASVADAQGEEEADLGIATIFDDSAVVDDSTQPATISSLTLEVGETALEVLMASDLVANVQASSLNSRLAAGDVHSMYVSNDGNLWAWGSNYYGQLGDGTTTNRTMPVQILPGVAAIAAGNYHSLALKNDGSLWAWGSNDSGQLGDGTTTNRTTPFQILTGITTAVAAGSSHTLALQTDGSLWAWGNNGNYQLGDGTRTDSSWPKQILTGVVDIAAGFYHSLALKTDGSLWAWGSNNSGQLGGGTNTYSSTPKQILTGVAAISAGSMHSLAIKTDGSLWAWGYNSYGQLGDGTTTDSSTPKQILTGVAAISAGNMHSLALKNDGSLWAWGRNQYGQLGDGTTMNRTTPFQILTGVTAMAAGGGHSLALKNDGSLWAWGRNDQGQLGDGTTTARLSPFLVKYADYPPSAPLSFDAQAISLTGITLTWIDASDNELNFLVERRIGEGAWALLTTLGANTTSYTDTGLTEARTYGYRVRAYNIAGFSDYTPEVTITLLPQAPSNLAANAVSGGLRIDLSWSDQSSGETAYQVERKTGSGGTWVEIGNLAANTTNYADTDLAAGVTYVYRVRAKNSAGFSSYSYAASATASTLPQAPSNLTTTAITPTLILLRWIDRSDNEWEYQIERKTGAEGSWATIATIPPNAILYADNVPVTTDLFYRVRAANGVGNSDYSNDAGVAEFAQGSVAAGNSHSLLLGSDGRLWAWGYNYYGQIGDGTTANSSPPKQILTGVVAVAAGGGHSLALKNDGSLWAWGRNDYGQLGDGTTTNSYTPKKILTGVVAVAAGGWHSLALKNDGSLWAWGSNGYGVLGDGTTMMRTTPTPILTGVVAVAAGGGHSLALKNDGSLWAWGWNSSGQLGDGTTTNRYTPKQILTGVVAMAAGGRHSLALKTDGSLWAWGDNYYGQLGDGSFGPNSIRTTPTQILTSVRSMDAGENHTLALKTDGSLWVWGDNSSGQLGDGTNNTTLIRPKKTLTDVAAISAGSSHSLALMTNGSLLVWGANNYGQLGDGTTTSRSSPYLVSGVAYIPPSAPTSLEAQAVSPTGITVTWADANDNELGFWVERRIGEGAWALFTTLGANTTSYVDTSLSEGVIYGYRVRSYNTAAVSDYTPEVTSTVLPLAPSNLAASVVSDTRIDLTWTDNSTGESAYSVERKTSASGTWAEIATLAANTTTYADTGLSAPITYVYRVRAANTAGYSAYSNEATATTVIIPTAPGNLTATTVSSGWVQLIWDDRSDNEWEFQLERKTGEAGTWSLLATLPVNVAGYADTGVAAGTTYLYRVRAANGAGVSGFSNDSSVTESAQQRLAAGRDHSMLIGSDGRLWAWGYNAYGQLGDGTTTTIYRPKQILSSVSSVEAGYDHSLAFKSDGSLWAWGFNSFGQLGDGSTTHRSTPKQIITDITAMSAGYGHTLAIKTDGGLWAWGSNSSGQLGDGTTNDSLFPRQIFTGIVAVATGGNHSLALKNDGSLWAWGFNGYGELGDGTTMMRTTPTPILTGVSAAVAGSFHSLALKNDGSLWAWGRNQYGQLGDGTTTNSPTPKQILTSVVAMTAGYWHTLALKADGSLWAWGNNDYGQLGDGTTTDSFTPKQVLTGVSAVVAGFGHTLALKTDGSLWAWGSNSYGELGDGTTMSRSSPYQISGVASDSPTAPTSLAAKAISPTGITLTWIDSSGNELGFQVERRSGEGAWTLLSTLGADMTTYADTGLTEGITYGYRLRAYNTVDVSDYTQEVTSTVLPKAPTGLGTRTVSDTRIDLTWTDNSTGESAYSVERKTSASGTWAEIATLAANTTTYTDTGLSAPITYVYRVRAANTAGYSTYSNEASATTVIIPTAPSNLTATAISSSRIQLIWEDRIDNEWEFQLERKTGEVGTWIKVATLPANTAGYADTGLAAATTYFYRLSAANGAGASPTSNEASATTLTQAAQPRVAAGEAYSLTLEGNGRLWAWGSNAYGQLGDGTTTNRTQPVAIRSDITGLSTGAHHSLAITSAGFLLAWGRNDQGQVGDNSTTNRKAPVTVLSEVSAAAGGTSHSLALKTDGSLWAWGANASGQLGDGDTSGSLVPIQILTGIGGLAAGGSHSLALTTDGRLLAWGGNTYGQLGNGSTDPGLSPVQIMSQVAAVAAGSEHSLALRQDGTLWAWGRNQYGQLGDGGGANRSSPYQILSGVEAIAAGLNHSLAITTDGRLLVWGLNTSGQLGTGNLVNSATPVEILTDIASVAGGAGHSLAIKIDGTLLAWGNNASGQVGDGTSTSRTSPVGVSGFGAAQTPAAPSALTATASSAVRVALAWQDNSGNETGFQLERKIGSGGTWSLLATLGANATSYADTGLSPATTYVYRLRAVNGAGASANSNEATVTTPALPIAPANLTATVATATAITLAWQDKSSDEAAFEVERKVGSEGNWSLLTTLEANATAYADISVGEKTSYSYRVRATNWAGASAYSNVADATTPALPLAPSNLVATFATLTRVDLSWQDNSDDEAGFKIERQVAGSGTWSQIATDVANTTSFADTTVIAGTPYSYRVRAYNWKGDSLYSNEADADYQLSVTASANTGGTVICDPTRVSYNGNSTCTATPDSGYTFDAWSGACKDQGATCTLANIQSNQSSTASFSPNTYAITANASPEAGGTVSCSPNPVDHGDNSACMATANAGYTFREWTGDCNGTSCVLTNVTAAKTVTATFSLNTYHVTATAGTGGTITPASQTVNHGATTTLTVAPETAYTASVTGCSGSLAGNTYTTGAITEACTVSATFSLNTYHVTATAGTGGTITPALQTVNHGATTTFSVTPNTSYSTNSVSGCGGSLSGNTYTTGQITGACTVTASFSKTAKEFCDETRRTLTNTIGPGGYSYASKVGIDTEGTVIIRSDADVVLTAPLIQLRPGFRVESGARLSIRALSVSCPP